MLRCGEEPAGEAVPDANALPLEFELVRFEDQVRRGPEVGLQLTARVRDRRDYPERFHVRFTLLDSVGNPFLTPDGKKDTTIERVATNSFYGSDFLGAAEESDDTATMEVLSWGVFLDEVRGLDLPDEQFPPMVQFYWPYHRFGLEPGTHKIGIAIEARSGELPEATADNFYERWQAGEEREVVGKMLFEGEVDRPQLERARVHVSYIELDNEAFDPHTMDRHKLLSRNRGGFPELYWSLGLGYELAFRSDFATDAISARWKEGSYDLWVSGPDELVSLCAMDKDDDEGDLLDDIVACWEGRLGDLSTDPDSPTVLRLERVRRMDVAVEWLGDNSPGMP